jgi:Ni/Co efflux regulator RcnB
MKVRTIVSAVTAASLAFGNAAFAQSTGASDQAQMRDNRGNIVRDATPNHVDANGQLQGNFQGVRRGDEFRGDDGRNQRGQIPQRADERNYRGDARGYDNRGYDNRGYDNRGYDNRGYDNRDYDNRGNVNRGYDNGGYEYRNYGFREGGYRGQGRGVGPSESWYRGDRLPYEYRTHHYVVDDWRSHHLYAPPRGYQWVQSGGDYLLVAVATGIIASILLNQ